MEVIVTQLNVLSQYSHEETEENHKKSVRIAGLWAKIWTQDLQTMKQEC
jgi:hypothetical protein